MGLGTTHDCWDGSYSGFKHFRDALSDAAGITNSHIDWAAVTEAQLDGHWGDTVPAFPDGGRDPLLYLLIHQDCQGVLEHTYLGALADRLDELTPAIESLGDTDLTADLRRFIAGLRLAQSRRENVEFH